MQPGFADWSLAAGPTEGLTTFVLLLGRAGGLVGSAPLIGAKMVPMRVQAALTVAIAAVLLPVAESAPAMLSAGAMVVAVAREIAIGAVLGLAAQFLFAAAQLGGQLAGIDMGLGIANVVDPNTQNRITPLSEWHQLIALLLFLTLDGHHQLIAALAMTVKLLPPGAAPALGAAARVLVALGGTMFVLGVKIAAPVLITLLLVDGVLGALLRTMPQLNVFIVGFPLKLGVAFLMFASGLPFLARLLAAEVDKLGGTIFTLARLLTGA